MGQVITKLRIETDEYQNRVRRAAASLSDMAHQCEVAGNRIAVSNKHNIALVQSLGKMQTASTTLRGKVSELSAAFIDASHSYNQLTSHEKRTQYGEALSASIDKLKTRLREAQNELRSLENEASGKSSIGGVTFGQKFMQGLVPGLGMGVGAAGALVAVQLTQKALGFMKDTIAETISENRNFEQANANLAAVLGKTRDEIGALTENAKQLGATTFYTAGQITELQTVLARLGFSDSQILAMTKDISNLAIATGTDLAQAAQLAGSTMRAFGMKASQMERITSVLGVSTTKSALTTEALATALQYVATDATNAGFSLEDTVALLGTLMNNGIQASTAGTSLRQILIQMSTANGKLAKSFGTTVHNLDEFVAAIKKVKEEGDGTIGSLSDKVRVTARSSLLALGANIEKAQELREQITDVGDELQKMADTQLNTLQGSATLMESAWNGLMLTFAQSNGTLKKTADWLTEVINKAVEWRKLKNGGESALSLFTKDPDKALAETRFELMRTQAEKNLADSGALKGVKDEKAIATAISNEIKRLIDEEVKKLETLDKSYQMVQESIDDIPNKVGFMGDQNAALQQQYGQLNNLNAIYPLASKNQYGVIDWSTQLLPTRGALRTDIGTWKFASGLADAMVSNDVFSNGTDKTDAERILEAIQANKSKKKTPAEIAEDKISDAMSAYESAINLATEEFKQDAIDSKSFLSKKQSAQERVYKAYHEAYELTGNEEYKKGMQDWIGKVVETAGNQGELNNALKALADKWKKEAAEQKALVDADKSIYGQMKSAVGRTAWDRIAQDGGDLNARFAAMKVKLDGGVEIPDKDWEDFVADLNEKLLSLKLAPIQLDLEAGTVNKMKNEAKETAQVWSLAAQSVSNIGSALQQIEDPSAKVAGIVATAIASTALGFAQASASPATGAAGIFGWIAASTAGLAQMAAMIASIKSVTTEYHAGGGFIGGPKGSDVVPMWGTPGELVLNRAQQTNLAAQLAPANSFNPNDFHLETEIRPDKFRVMLVQNDRRRGGTGNQYRIK